MSCYFRHVKHILQEAGIEVSSDNKKQIDQAIHEIIGTTYKDCPGTWKKLKLAINDENKKQELIGKLHSISH